MQTTRSDDTPKGGLNHPDWTEDTVCHSCGKVFSKISSHWSQSSCPHPEPSATHHEMFKGLLLGDGHLDRSSTNSRIGVYSTNLEYLQWMQREVGDLSGCIRVNKDARTDKRFGRTKDLYCFSTLTSDYFNRFDSWYDGPSDTIDFPESLCLSPELLSAWYVGDGTWQGGAGPPRIVSRNEYDNQYKLDRYVDTLPFETRVGKTGGFIFIAPDSGSVSKWFEYMGDPPPGFEYKWP